MGTGDQGWPLRNIITRSEAGLGLGKIFFFLSDLVFCSLKEEDPRGVGVSTGICDSGHSPLSIKSLLDPALPI